MKKKTTGNRFFDQKKPPEYWGNLKKRGVKLGKALNDKEAIFCRNNLRKFGVKRLAEMFDVSETCVKRCVQGITYQHLDGIAEPWQY